MVTLDELTRTEQALFRFSLIAPLINGSVQTSVQEYLETVCARKYDAPGAGPREYSPHTVRLWYVAYRKHGLEGLKPKPRSDRGESRALSAEARQFLCELAQASPGRPSTLLHQDLLRSGIQTPAPSRSTVARYLNKVKHTEVTEPAVERKRFEMQYANDCWQSDICVGPYLTLEARKKRRFLIAFLDDASRLCVHAEFSFDETYLAVEAALKKALLKRGIPKKLFMDNGRVFRSLQMRIICAKLGIVPGTCAAVFSCVEGQN